MKEICSTLKILYDLNIDPDLWEAQNIFYFMAKDILKVNKVTSKEHKIPTNTWIELFNSIQDLLKIRVVID